MSNYRDNRADLANNVQDLKHELGHLHAENMAMRQAILQQPRRQFLSKQLYENPYARHGLEPGHRVALTHHNLREFPVWLVVLLHFMTLGLFSIFHFGGLHGSLPQASDDDPSGGKGAGFFFIPYYNVYWTFFANLRLYDRLELQFDLRGQRMPMSRGLVKAAAIVGLIPWFNLLIGFPIMWLLVGIQFQQAVNQLAKLPPLSPQMAPQLGPGAHVPGQHQAGYGSPYTAPGYGTPPPALAPPMAMPPQPYGQPQPHGYAQPQYAQAPQAPTPQQTGPWGYPSPNDQGGGSPQG